MRPRSALCPRRDTFPHRGAESVRSAFERVAVQSDSSDGSIVDSSSAPSDEAGVSRKMVVQTQPKFRCVDLAWLSRSAQQQLQADAGVGTALSDAAALTDAGLTDAAALADADPGGPAGGSGASGGSEGGDEESWRSSAQATEQTGASEADAEASQSGDGGLSVASSDGSSSNSARDRRPSSRTRGGGGASARPIDSIGAATPQHHRALHAPHRGPAHRAPPSMPPPPPEAGGGPGGSRPASSSSVASSSSSQRRRSASRSQRTSSLLRSEAPAPTRSPPPASSNSTPTRDHRPPSSGASSGDASAAGAPSDPAQTGTQGGSFVASSWRSVQRRGWRLRLVGIGGGPGGVTGPSVVASDDHPGWLCCLSGVITSLGAASVALRPPSRQPGRPLSYAGAIATAAC